MKRVLKIITLVLLVMVFSFGALACIEPDDEQTAKGLKYKQDAKTGLYTVYGYVDDGKTTCLDLGNVKDKDGNSIVVGKISVGAFSGNNTITEIIVPTTVTQISAGAFKNMNKLEKITLPFVGKNVNSDAYPNETEDTNDKSVNEERTFAYVFGTEAYEYGAPVTITYGAGTKTYYIPVYLKQVTIISAQSYSIPMYAFSGTPLIREVILGDKIDAIGDNAFSSCHDLLSVNIPTSVLKIYKEAFLDSENFGKNFTLEQKATLKNAIDLVIADGATDVYSGTYLD